MLLTKQAQYFLTADKKADSAAVMAQHIKDYLKTKNNYFFDSIDDLDNTKEDLTPGIYADHIKIISSANEPKIYFDVISNTGKNLFTGRILNNDYIAYSEAGKIAGALLETFNLYAYYNNL